MSIGIAPAYAVVLDNFLEDDNSCDTTQVGVGTATCTDTSITDAANTIKKRRDGVVQVTAAAGGSADAMIEVFQFANIGFFTYDSAFGVNGLTSLHYGDGMDLNADWSSFSKFNINLQSNDLPLVVTAKVEDMDGDSDTSSPINVGASAGPTTLMIPFSDFGNNVDFDKVKKVWFTFDPITEGEFGITMIYIPEEIGGEFVGVDTAALLLAGAEMNSYWILPLITLVGIGAFIYSRKRN